MVLYNNILIIIHQNTLGHTIYGVDDLKKLYRGHNSNLHNNLGEMLDEHVTFVW